MKSPDHLGRSDEVKDRKNMKKVKNDGLSDGQIKRDVESRSTQLKTKRFLMAHQVSFIIGRVSMNLQTNPEVKLSYKESQTCFSKISVHSMNNSNFFVAERT